MTRIADIHTTCFLIERIDGVVGFGLLCRLAHPTRMSSKQQFMLMRPKVTSIDDINTMCFLIKRIDGVLELGLLCGLALMPVDTLLMDLSGGGSNGWWTRDTGLGRH